MFDIDGTLIESSDFDSSCFQAAIQDVLNTTIDSNWERYHNVTDSGILTQIIDDLHLQIRRDSIIAAVKHHFFACVFSHLTEHGVLPISGAPEFLRMLLRRKDVRLAIATGGWFESADLKLKAAGIDRTGIAFASSSDHLSRIEIMRMAETRSGCNHYRTKTYFGDASWDRDAAKVLGYNFILVGNRIKHKKSIQDFTATDEVLAHLGF